MKKFAITLLFLGTACGAVSAADKTDKAPATQKKAAPAAVAPAEKSTPTTEQAIKRLAELDQSVQTLQFDFQQTLFFDETGLTREVAGKVHFSRPDKIRIEHSKPQPQIVYTDKKTILIYKPADRQALKSSWKQWLNQQASTLTGIAELGDYAALANKHELDVSRSKNGDLLFNLRPKNNPKAYTLTLVLSDTDYFPHAITFTVGKTRFETLIKN
ncbi:MAG TPA: outer membrane lipoprotein carrier protein LolA, partial [Elusimicrobiales bacterium]|nr:outer membrane lipoprotein carrier protein LolA [Elusimicrobiales bacterium]